MIVMLLLLLLEDDDDDDDDGGGAGSGSDDDSRALAYLATISKGHEYLIGPAEPLHGIRTRRVALQ